jgi:hypothetical protein
MSTAFDPRIVQVSIAFPEGALTLEGLSIYATGQKFQAAAFNTCQCQIFNLTKEQRNYILSRTSPLNNPRTPIPMNLNVGRQSYGTFNLFSGYIQKSSATQPPDIGITLTALTSGFLIGALLSETQQATTQLSTIAQNIAANNGLSLNFLATDKQINNFSYVGSIAYQINSLNEMGGIIASVDNGILTVINAGQSINIGTRLINANNGMIGIPQFYENGVIVKMMIDKTVQLGDKVTIESKQLPAANGDYIIIAIIYEVASRDQQFYYTLTCLSIGRSPFAGTL